MSAWRNVGKTNLLLQFMDDQAKYIGDDWCILDKDKNIQIAPKRVNLLDYNLLAFPDLIKKIDEKIVSMLEIYKGYQKVIINLVRKMLKNSRITLR